MYLDHFGLHEPPFRITPSTTFFFSGANRGEILDALVYSLSESEGIIKVSGEVGSGKTMLCRMLLERLPKYIDTIYLANPSLSRDEMLYAIADGLGLNVEGERVGIIMHSIQARLEERAREGKRVVVLVDEAHAMPPDTLEELRLLYNLQVGNFKLLQLILFGQPELNNKLEQPNMRQLKDRIVHHFNMQPMSHNTLESYLMFRMRAAGYHGPNVFSPQALKLIGRASEGLMRRINILADKSLLAAFVEDTHNIEPRHVQAAMRDSELQSSRKLKLPSIELPSIQLPPTRILAGGAVVALLLTGLTTWWATDETQPAAPAQQAQLAAPAMPITVAPTPVAPTIQALEQTAIAPPAPAVAQKTSPPPAAKGSLFDQRLAAGKKLLGQKNIVASIQLFHNEDMQPKRVEGFLKRADGLGKLSEIYLVPARFGDKEGLRILYGAYPSVDAARNAIKDLPSRYQESFATAIHVF
ncbi:MAG: AAA family ATPase [Gallionella sp.]|jgi:type II secretory pathway predicted ATPase ExeA|nr:AAA family ATPase [Gallionella sp.]MCK9355252.1 AAA family ATPase [Gallionella sp.]